MKKEKGYFVDKKGNITPMEADKTKFIHGLISIYRLSWVENAFPVFAYTKLTRCPERYQYIDRKEYTQAEKAITERPEPFGKLLTALAALYQVHAYNRLLEAHRAGKIRPELEALFNVYVADPEAVAGTMEGNYSALVLQAAAEGVINFDQFNFRKEKEWDWFKKYRLDTHVIPGIYGAVADIDRTIPGPGAKTQLELFHEKVKAEMKRDVLELLESGAEPETILSLADEIKDRYNKNKKAGIANDLNRIIRYGSEYETGFVVDIKQAKIYDIRPYTADLAELLEPNYDPLKEFYYALRRYVTDSLKKGKPAADKTPQELFENAPFLMMRNSRESNAIASVSGSMMQIAVQQELAFENEGNGSGSQLYNYSASVPMKNGEVIISVKETPKGGVLRPSTEKLHILFDTLFTKSGYNEFVFPIDAYMELCKRTPGKISPENRRKFRQKLRQDLQRMKSTKFSANLPGCKPGEIGILNAWLPAPNNCIYVKLESLYCNSLRQRNAGKMQMPITIFKTNEQNPHLIPIMRALCRNRTDYNNINAEAVTGSNRAHNISLKTLYEWDLALPRWEQVKKKGNWKFRQDIIEPLFKAIKELNEENYITSKYIDRDGIEHTEADMKTAGIVDILDPEKWLLNYELVGFKDDPVMIQEALARKRGREEQRIQEAAKAMAKKLAGKKKGTKNKKQ